MDCLLDYLGEVMNKRIKELITEAWSIPACKISDIFHWDREEKFAELIVRECAEIARLNTGVDSKVCLMIKQHFGVEE